VGAGAITELIGRALLPTRHSERRYAEQQDHHTKQRSTGPSPSP